MGREARARARSGHRRGWFRRPRSRWLAAGAAAVLLAAVGVGAWRWDAARAVPEPAPRFNLMASTGKVYTLDDFAGKQEVVLIFYMGAG
jgi:hypothetical protein